MKKVRIFAKDKGDDIQPDLLKWEMPSTAPNAVDIHRPRRFVVDAETEQWELENLLEQHRRRHGGVVSSIDKIPPIDMADASSLEQHTTAPEMSESMKEDGEDTSDEEEEESEESEHGWRKTAKIVLPHIGLFLLTCTYTLIGASVFYSIERPNELNSKRQKLMEIEQNRLAFLNFMWNLSKTGISEESWKEEGAVYLLNVTDQLFYSFERYFITAADVKNNTPTVVWTFSTAIFFAVTVVTTIGYGNPVPVTMLGRSTCVIFALFGIPLTLVTVADIGKFFSEHLVWLYGKYLGLKHRIRNYCHRKKTKSDKRSVCEHCIQDFENLHEKRIPATLVLAILIGDHP